MSGAERLISAIVFFCLLLLMAIMVKRLWRGMGRTVVGPQPKIPIALGRNINPQVKDQLAPLTARRDTLIEVRNRYKIRGGFPWESHEMTVGVVYHSIDALVRRLDRARRRLVRKQRPLSLVELNELLALGWQFVDAQRASELARARLWRSPL